MPHITLEKLLSSESFSNYNVKIQTISMLGINDIDETGKTFEENAIIKVKMFLMVPLVCLMTQVFVLKA